MEHCVITLQDLLDSANQKRLPTHQEMIQKSRDIKWGASSRWPFRPNSDASHFTFYYIYTVIIDKIESQLIGPSIFYTTD